MHKKQSRHLILIPSPAHQKQKQKQKQKGRTPRKCHFCHAERVAPLQPIAMVGKSLIKKYSQQIDDSTATSSFNCFVSGETVVYGGGIREFMVTFALERENIGHYYDMASTKKIITQVVRSNALKFKANLIHFHQPFFRIMTKDRRIANNNNETNNPNPQIKIQDIFANSFIRLAQTKQKDQRSIGIGPATQDKMRKYSKKKEGKGNGEGAFRGEIRKLCNRIGVMCSQVDSQRESRKFRERLEALAKMRKQSKEELKFKSELQINFSIIGKESSRSKQKQKLKSKIKTKKTQLISREVQQIYGISSSAKKQSTTRPQPKLNKANRPYSNKRSQTERVQILADSPISQAYYTKEYNYTETAGPIRSRKKGKLYSLSPGLSGKGAKYRNIEGSIKSYRQTISRSKSRNKLKTGRDQLSRPQPQTQK